MSTFSFENLWNDATLWAERQSEHIFTQGRSLTPEEMDLARKARVTAPERIRILSVPEVPFPEDPTLRAIAAQT